MSAVSTPALGTVSVRAAATVGTPGYQRAGGPLPALASTGSFTRRGPVTYAVSRPPPSTDAYARMSSVAASTTVTTPHSGTPPPGVVTCPVSRVPVRNDTSYVVVAPAR